MTLSQNVIECFVELPNTAHESTFPHWLTAVSTLAALLVPSGATGGTVFCIFFLLNISFNIITEAVHSYVS